MATRKLSANSLSFENKQVTIWARIAIGATGAPTLQMLNRNSAAAAWQTAGSNGYNGVKSITRSSAGKYVLTLMESYVELLAFWAGFTNDTAPAALSIAANVTGTNVKSASAPQITFTCYNGSGVATDPASGEVMVLEIALTDSMAP